MTVDEILQEIARSFDVRNCGPPPSIDERWQAYAKNFKGDTKAHLVENFVQRDCPHLDRSKVLYVSVGGAEGDELEWALKYGGYGYGLLFEYVAVAAETAKSKLSEWTNTNRCRVICGDVAQNIENAEQWIDSLCGANGVLISAQAVLHELPTRAHPAYSFQRLLMLAANKPIKLLHSREPVCPDNRAWHGRITLRIPSANPKLIVNAAKAIQARFSARMVNAPGFNGYIQAVALGAEMPGLVAIELLHKFLRYESPSRLQHELEECLVAEDAKTWAEAVRQAFDQVHPVPLEYSATEGFKNKYRKHGIIAIESNSCYLPVPLCFATIEACNCEASQLSNASGVVPARASQPTPDQPLNTIIRSLLEAVRDLALQNVLVYPPSHLKTNQFLEFCFPARVTYEEDFEKQFSYLSKRAGLKPGSDQFDAEREATLNLPRLTLEQTQSQCKSHVLLRGEPGEGKTTAVWVYVAECCADLVQRLYADPECSERVDFVVPLAVSLASFSGEASTPSGAVEKLRDSLIDHMLECFVVEAGSTRSRLREWLKEKFNRQECSLFLDAYDEATKAAGLVVAMACQQLSGYRILMTSRVTGDTRSVLVNPLRLRMICFGPRDVDLYLNRYFAGSPQRAAALATIRSRLSLSSGVRSLARIPLLLASICSLVEFDPKSDIPASRHGLLSRAMGEMMRRGAVKRKQSFDRTRANAKMTLLGRLAWRFWARGNQLLKVEQLDPASSDEPFDREDLLKELINSDGVLIKRKLGHAFILQSFHELCLANHIASDVFNSSLTDEACISLVRSPGEKWPRVRKWSGFVPFYHPSWTAVWPLLAGVIAPRVWLLEAIDMDSPDVASSRMFLSAVVLTEALGSDDGVGDDGGLLARAQRTVGELVLRLTDVSLPFRFRADVIKALAAFPAEFTYGPLKTVFQNESLSVPSRCEIASALGEVSTSEAVGLLSDTAIMCDNDRLRAYAVAALGRCASDESILVILRQLEGNPPTLVKFACLSALQLLGESDLCGSHVIGIINDSERNAPEVRVDAIQLAARLPWALVKPVLTRILEKPGCARTEDDDLLRQYCFYAMGSIAVPESRDLIIKYLYDVRGHEVFSAGIQSLGEIGDGVVIDYLETLLLRRVDDVGVCVPAMVELSRLGKQVWGRTVMESVRKDLLTPYWIAYALRRINARATQGYAEVVAGILETTNDNDVRFAAAAWFRRADSANSGDLLAAILSRSVSSQTAFVVAVTGAALGEDRCLAALVRECESRSAVSDLNKVAEALVAHGESEARSCLARLADHKKPEVRSMIHGHLYELFLQTGWRLLTTGEWVGPTLIES